MIFGIVYSSRSPPRTLAAVLYPFAIIRMAHDEDIWRNPFKCKLVLLAFDFWRQKNSYGHTADGWYGLVVVAIRFFFFVGISCNKLRCLSDIVSVPMCSYGADRTVTTESQTLNGESTLLKTIQCADFLVIWNWNNGLSKIWKPYSIHHQIWGEKSKLKGASEYRVHMSLARRQRVVNKNL